MNVENLRILAHELRADPDSYDQSEWIYPAKCGTVACIGGHAAMLAGGDGQQDAERWLGLTLDQAANLFVGDPHWCRVNDFSYHWPVEYAKRWRAAISGRSVEVPAFVAADLLDALADGKVKL